MTVIPVAAAVSIMSQTRRRSRKRSTLSLFHCQRSAMNRRDAASCPRPRDTTTRPIRLPRGFHAASAISHIQASRSVNGSGAKHSWSNTPRSIANTPRSLIALSPLVSHGQQRAPFVQNRHCIVGISHKCVGDVHVPAFLAVVFLMVGHPAFGGLDFHVRRSTVREREDQVRNPPLNPHFLEPHCRDDVALFPIGWMK